MTWFNQIATSWTVGAVVGAVLAAAFLWWALADLFLATFELPFGDVLDRWRRRLGPRRDGHDEDEGAGATA
jgi:hypothetical protein